MKKKIKTKKEKQEVSLAAKYDGQDHLRIMSLALANYSITLNDTDMALWHDLDRFFAGSGTVPVTLNLGAFCHLMNRLGFDPVKNGHAYRCLKDPSQFLDFHKSILQLVYVKLRIKIERALKPVVVNFLDTFTETIDQAIQDSWDVISPDFKKLLSKPPLDSFPDPSSLYDDIESKYLSSVEETD